MTRLTTTITLGQQEQYKRFVEDAGKKALDEVGLDKDRLQKLIENGDEFQAEIVASIKKYSAYNQFVDEEVYSDYAYPKKYRGPRPIVDQIWALFEVFDLDTAQALEYANNLPNLPVGAEGWFAIPNIWKKEGIPKIFGTTYSEAVRKILDAISRKPCSRFYNWHEGLVNEKHLCRLDYSHRGFQKLSEEQVNPDIIIIPAQFGINHKGHFDLGAFAVGSMILTHPERLQYHDDLRIDCAGDGWSFKADGKFDHVPFFFFAEGIGFSSRPRVFKDVRYGAASGFIFF